MGMDDIVAATRSELAEFKARHPHLVRDQIAELAQVNRHWLEKFDQGVIDNPTMRNLGRLRQFLAAMAAERSAKPAPTSKRPIARVAA